MNRPFPWEKLYPPGLRWDTPLETSTLPALLDRAAARHGDRTAIDFRGHRLSFRRLGQLADAMAARLLGLGIGAGQTVALYMPNSPWHPAGFFGVLRTGARVTQLSPLDPPRASARKLADTGARLVITTNLPPLLPNALELLHQGHADRLIVTDETAWGPDEAALPVPDDPRILCVQPDRLAEPPARWPALSETSLALLQFTGGTTGLPRAAMLTHANLTATVAIYQAWNAGIGRAVRPDDKAICVLPLFHIFALTAVLLRALSGGIELLLHRRFDAAAVLADIESKRATMLAGVPTMWMALANHPGVESRDLGALRVCGSGGATLPVEVARRWKQLTGLRIGGGWGMTETSPAGTGLLPEMEASPGCIGVPLPGIMPQVVALDDPRRVLPPGEAGEIRVKGPNVFQGYWNRPEETEAAFADGFFLTGDIGTMSPAGVFTLVDRKKDMIISGGFNVYPRVIEEALYEHPDVAEAAVIGIPDAHRGQAAKAFIRLRHGAHRFALDALRDFLATRIGRHELPAALEFRDELPHTPVGKIARRVLAEQDAAARQPEPQGS